MQQSQKEGTNEVQSSDDNHSELTGVHESGTDTNWSSKLVRQFYDKFG